MTKSEKVEPLFIKKNFKADEIKHLEKHVPPDGGFHVSAYE